VVSSRTRQVVVPTFVGLCAGLAGAMYGAHLSASKVAPPPHEEPTPPQRPSPVSAVPPGWNRAFLSRLGALETKVERVEHDVARAAAAPVDEEREAALEDHYRASLVELEGELRQHAREPVDSTWATAANAEISRTLGENVDAKYPFEVVSVDCRTQTCVAQVRYRTPDDAVSNQQELLRIHPASCHGLRTTLVPPTSASNYETPVIYYCR
jgi:hypothetical protein